MLKIIIIIVALILILIASLWFKIKRRDKALIVLQTASQKVVTKALATALQLVQTNSFNGADPHCLQVLMVDDIWGKGVLVFEYEISNCHLQTAELPEIKSQLQKALLHYSEHHQLVAYSEQYPLFVVSDAWVLNENLHLDISYVINQPTVGYLHDIEKLEK